MKFKRLFCLVLAVVMAVSMTVFAHAEEAKLISTCEEFLTMTTGNYKLINDLDFTATTYTSALIENFSGTLDGDGYTVKIKIEANADSNAYSGIFGTLSGTVKNLKVDGSISVKALTDSIYVHAGGIAGLNVGVIDNCFTYADVEVDGGTEIYAGGVSGINRKNSNVGKIISCFNYADITIKGQTEGVETVGGISGIHGKVEACRNFGNVKLDCSSSLMSYGAGIVAYDGEVKLSMNSGNIDVKSGMQAYGGGIVAFLDNSSYTYVHSNVNRGKVNATVIVPEGESDGTLATAGGIAGYLAGFVDFTEDGEVDVAGCTAVVRDCLNSGDISASLSDAQAGNSYAGGIAGVVNGAAFYCVNEGDSFTAEYYGPIFASVNPTEILRGTVYDCYTLEANSDTLITAANTVAKVKTITDTEYKTKTTYDKFDFESIWALENNTLSIRIPEHTHVDESVYMPPTCETDAWLDSICKLCGYEHRSIFEDSALNHSPDGDWIKDETGHWHTCTNTDCDKKVDFAKHSFGEYVSDGNATTMQDGTKTRVCSVCEYKETVTDKGSKLPQKPKYDFKDVDKSSWYADVVYYAAENGLMTGTGDSTFDPSVNLNRATFVTILAKVEGVFDSLTTDTKTQFSDVPAGKWYTGTVKWAAKVGVTDGMGDGTFAPMKEITREQMCTMFGRYVEYRKITLNTKVNKKESFKDDKDISSWAKAHVYDCQMAGIVNGMGDGTFAPKGTANRAQAAKIFTVFHQNYLAK